MNTPILNMETEAKRGLLQAPEAANRVATTQTYAVSPHLTLPHHSFFTIGTVVCMLQISEKGEVGTVILVGKRLLTFTKTSVRWNKLENTELMYVESKGSSRHSMKTSSLFCCTGNRK